MTDAQKRAKKSYRARCSRTTIEFYQTDADIVAHLGGIDGKQTYIKALIRADMDKNRKEGEGC